MKTKNVVSIYFFLILFSVCTHAQKPVGIFNPNANKSISLSRNGKIIQISSHKEYLYANDILVGQNLLKLKISWMPYAGWTQRNDSTYAVYFSPPKATTGFLAKIADALSGYLGFVKEDVYATSMVERGNENIELPAGSVSALMCYSIPFSSISFVRLSLADSIGNKIYECTIEPRKTVNLDPTIVGLKAGAVYTWIMKSKQNTRTGVIRILLEKEQSEILKDIKEIEQGAKTKEDLIIKKASYLQLISDMYSENIDFYWLSYQVLQAGNFSNDSQANDLEKRFYKHHGLGKQQ